MVIDERDVASVDRVIAAPPERIFEVLADPSRHQEIDGSGTVRAPTGPPQRLELGAKFGMSMLWGVPYAMVNEVVEFEPNRRIAWQPRPAIAPLRLLVGGRIWRYELEPVPGGTLVRETWDISQEAVKRVVRPLRARTIEAMTRTLERLEDVVTR